MLFFFFCLIYTQREFADSFTALPSESEVTPNTHSSLLCAHQLQEQEGRRDPGPSKGCCQLPYTKTFSSLMTPSRRGRQTNDATWKILSVIEKTHDRQTWCGTGPGGPPKLVVTMTHRPNQTTSWDPAT